MASGDRLVIAPQVLYEMVHVTTDGRRMPSPLSMEEALRMARAVWDASEAERLNPSAGVLSRAFDLIHQHKLGRKRILDTVLAATLEEARCERLATLNGRDFKIFPFLTVIDPTQNGQG